MGSNLQQTPEGEMFRPRTRGTPERAPRPMPSGWIFEDGFGLTACSRCGGATPMDGASQGRPFLQPRSHPQRRRRRRLPPAAGKCRSLQAADVRRHFRRTPGPGFSSADLPKLTAGEPRGPGKSSIATHSQSANSASSLKLETLREATP